MIQKNNSVTSAETKDDSSTKVEVTTSSPNNAKPIVGSSVFILIDEYDRPYILSVDELQLWETDGSISKGDRLYKAELFKQY